VYGEGQIEVAHVLIGLIGFGRDLEQLGHVLFFSVKLRHAGFDLPLVKLRVCIGGDADDLSQIHFEKVIRGS
jgi:hypothetical protein